MPGYDGCPGYEGIGAGVRGYWCRGTRVLVPWYEGIGAGVRGYWYRGRMVLVPGYEGIGTGVRVYEGIGAGVRGYWCRGTRVRGYVWGTRVRGYEGTRVRGYVWGTSMSGYLCPGMRDKYRGMKLSFVPETGAFSPPGHVPFCPTPASQICMFSCTIVPQISILDDLASQTFKETQVKK